MPVPSPQSPVSGLQSPVPSPPSPVSSLQSPVSSLLSKYLPLAAFAILWLDLIHLLSSNWEAREQYAYGWFVPFFAAALLWRRWLDRPLPQSPVPSLQSPVSSPWSVVSGLLMIFLAALLLPLRIVFEINTDWPLIAWPYTTIIVLLTLYAFHLAGPKSPVSSLQSPVSSPWLWHFAFPTAFILVALVWPWRIENALTQNLMQIVASLTVEILGWLNVPALQRGNLIEISTGVLGVDEACSGIRSFQSTLMAGLLMGELYRLKIWARAALVLIGLGLAFCFNVVRTLVLTWQANKIGMSAVDDWHDPAGYTIAIACFISLWALALLASKHLSTLPSRTSDLGPPTSGSGSTSDLRPLTSVGSPSDLRPLASGPPSDLRPLTSGSTSPLWPRYCLALGIWSLLTIATTEAWYRSHAITRAQTAQWWVSYPTDNPTFKPVTVSKAAAKLLKHDQESGGSWTEPDGTHWSVFCFRWKEGDSAARMSAQGHRPEYCMVGSGHKMLSMSDITYIPVHGLNLPFRLYNFESGGQPLHVFFALWEDGEEKQAGFSKTKTEDRLRTALAGRRGMGQQTLEIITTGYADMDAAQHAVRQCLPNLINLDSPPALVSSEVHSQ